MSKILFGTPVRVKNTVLNEFLQGLEDIEKGNNEVSYYFVDDNVDEVSSNLLKSFAKRNDTIIKKGTELFQTNDNYDGHNWKFETLAKVTVYKNTIIQYCIDNNYDYLFLIDSDIVLDKRSLLQLLSDDVEIVSNVFWNQWKENGILTPQCLWLPDIYILESSWNTMRPFAESHKMKMDVIEQMKTPGLYPVDGTGECTLIKREALEKGVNFTEIPNVKLLGEDRPFCIRAGALGYTLYMDTHYPAYHCSKEIYLDRIEEFRRDGWKFDMCCRYDNIEKKIKPFPKSRKFITRIAKRVVRDLSD